MGTPLTFGPGVQPVNFDRVHRPNSFFVGRQGTTAGWGRIVEGVQTETENLNWANVRIITDESCRIAFTALLSPTDICSQGWDVVAQGPCSEDAGGPLTITEDDGSVNQIGIVSFFMSPCDRGFPSAYVRVSPYISWIEQTTGL